MKCRACTCHDFAIWEHKLDGGSKLLLADIGELRAYRLVWLVIDHFPGDGPGIVDAIDAEIAFTIVDEKRLGVLRHWGIENGGELVLQEIDIWY